MSNTGNDQTHGDHRSEKKPDDTKYEVNVEGTVHPWPTSTITVEQIASLGGWTVTEGVIEVDAKNEEHTLAPGTVVELKPGHSFGRKVKFKRGSAPADRMTVELRLLQTVFPKASLDSTGTWVLIPGYPTSEGWSLDATDVAIHVTPDYFGGGVPYGFFVASGLLFNKQTPLSFQDVAANKPPFPGNWGFFSWTPHEGWRAHVDPTKGSNLLVWARGFAQRFKEGVGT